MAIKNDRIGICRRICLNKPRWEKDPIFGFSNARYDAREDYALKEYFKEAIEHMKKAKAMKEKGIYSNELNGVFSIIDYYKNYSLYWNEKIHPEILGEVAPDFINIPFLFGWLFTNSMAFVGHSVNGKDYDCDLTPFEIEVIKEILNETKETFLEYGAPVHIAFDQKCFHKVGLESGYEINDVSDIEGIINTLKSLSETADDTMGESSHGDGGLSSR